MKFLKTMVRDKWFWSLRGLLIMLLVLHEYYRTITRRSFTELFYWPEGICIDMIIVISFFCIAVICIENDIRLFLRYRG